MIRTVTIAPALFGLAALAALAACDKKECTKDELDQKATSLMVTVQAFSAANPDRMPDVGARVAELIDQSQSASGEFQPICDAIDKLAGEIGG